MESTEIQDLNFKKLWLIVKQRWIPGVSVFAGITALTVIFICLQKPVYKAEGKLFIKKLNQTSAVTGLGQQIAALDSAAQQTNPVKTEVEVVRSRPLVQHTITALNLQNEDGSPLRTQDFLKKHFKVKNLALTDILLLSYKSHDSQEAAAVVNKLMNLYLENNLHVNREAAGVAASFVNVQLPQSQKAVHQAEKALLTFKQQNYVVNLEEETKSTVAVIKEIETKITETQAQLADVNARYANLRDKVNMSSHEGISLNSLNQSLGVQNALKELQQVEDELSVQRTRLQDDHPIIVNLKLKKAALKDLLQKRIEQVGGVQPQVANGSLQIGESKQKLNEDLVKTEAERSGIASRLAKLSNDLVSYRRRMNNLPNLERQHRELQRQLEAAQSTYEILLKKSHEINVAENENMINGRIIEPAVVPDRRSLLEPAITFGLGTILAIVLSGVTVAALELTDTSIKTLKRAIDSLGYTVLGVIPSWNKKTSVNSIVSQLPVRDTPQLPICEAYRILQANLKFISSDRPLRVIVVTSSVSREGKSTVSANLAATMAQLGRRVLLIDGDLRRPFQHNIWGVTNVAGLSNVIVHQAEFEESVTQVMTNLDLLTCGVIPPTPLALLDSQRMASLIESFSERYDFVIIDTPPVTVGADALTLGKMTDGILFVARPGVVNYTSATTAKKFLATSGLKVLGLVVNDVRIQEEPDSYFYYSEEYYIENKKEFLRAKNTLSTRKKR